MAGVRPRSSATAILDRFLHHAEIVKITGKSYRLRSQAAKLEEDLAESKAAKAPTGSADATETAKAAKAPPGSEESPENSKTAKAPMAGHKRADKVANGQSHASR